MLSLTVNTAGSFQLARSYFDRKYKLESEIGRKEWLVDFHEVQHRKSRANDSFMSRASLSVDVKVISIKE